MSRAYRCTLLALFASIAGLGLCCQKPNEPVGPTAEDRAQPRSTDDRAANKPSTRPDKPDAAAAVKPDASAAAQPPAAAQSEPSGTVRNEKPRLPDYIRVLAPADRTRGTDVSASLPESGVINLQTANVRRLQLTREALPFASAGSIAVRIDGQGIEWQPRYPVLELELLQNGSWEIVRRPARP